MRFAVKSYAVIIPAKRTYIDYWSSIFCIARFGLHNQASGKYLVFNTNACRPAVLPEKTTIERFYLQRRQAGSESYVFYFSGEAGIVI